MTKKIAKLYGLKAKNRGMEFKEIKKLLEQKKITTQQAEQDEESKNE